MSKEAFKYKVGMVPSWATANWQRQTATLSCLCFQLPGHLLSMRACMQGPVHAAMTIAKEDGLVRGLWAGAAPTVMRNGTNQMCLFWAKNNFDR